jgi:hypothetical protein
VIRRSFQVRQENSKKSILISKGKDKTRAKKKMFQSAGAPTVREGLSLSINFWVEILSGHW